MENVDFELPIPLQEAAQKLGVQYHRLRKAAYDGRLKSQKVGNQYMSLLSEVKSFLIEGDGRKKQNNNQLTPTNSPTNRNGHTGLYPASTKEGEVMSLARVIAVTAPKGGTGKTTTTLNLGAALLEMGYRVLLVDCDPQGNLTLSAGIEASQIKNGLDNAIKQYLATYTPRLESTIITSPTGLDLVPSNIRLAGISDELLINSQGVVILQKLLRSVRPRYDFILIDTLPSLGVLVKNALVAAQEVIIPHETEPLSAEAVAMMLKQVEIMRLSELNPELRVAGILLTKVTKARLHREVADFTRQEFGKRAPVFRTIIERSVQFGEAQGLRKTILAYRPKDKGAQAYRNLAKELIYGPEAVEEIILSESEEVIS